MSPPIFPPSLRPGDRVAVVAPASPPNPEELRRGIDLLATHYSVEVMFPPARRVGYLAGHDDQRARSLQRALDDPSVKAVVAARGGYGTSRILERIDFHGFAGAPKWIVGSSDLTALLTHLLATFGVASIHGPMAAGLSRADATDANTLFDLLEGRFAASSMPLTPLLPGRAEGPLIGGNLTVLAHMAGALPPALTNGAILFLEDVGEKPYRLDRCLTQLKRSGFTKGLSGLVFGEFTDCIPNPDGVTAEDVLRDFAREARIPAAAGFAAAHGNRNVPFVQGRRTLIEVTDRNAVLSFSSSPRAQ